MEFSVRQLDRVTCDIKNWLSVKKKVNFHSGNKILQLLFDLRKIL